MRQKEDMSALEEGGCSITEGRTLSQRGDKGTTTGAAAAILLKLHSRGCEATTMPVVARVGFGRLFGGYSACAAGPGQAVEFIAGAATGGRVPLRTGAAPAKQTDDERRQ